MREEKREYDVKNGEGGKDREKKGIPAVKKSAKRKGHQRSEDSFRNWKGERFSGGRKAVVGKVGTFWLASKIGGEKKRGKAIEVRAQISRSKRKVIIGK